MFENGASQPNGASVSCIGKSITPCAPHASSSYSASGVREAAEEVAELADRERAAPVRPQHRGREVERDAVVLADRVRLALVPVPHRPHGRRRGDAHLVGVDERGRDGADDVARLRFEPAQITLEVRRRIRLVVDVRALVVVELHGEHAVRDGFALAQRTMQPA